MPKCPGRCRRLQNPQFWYSSVPCWTGKWVSKTLSIRGCIREPAVLVITLVQILLLPIYTWTWKCAACTAVIFSLWDGTHQCGWEKPLVRMTNTLRMWIAKQVSAWERLRNQRRLRHFRQHDFFGENILFNFLSQVFKCFLDSAHFKHFCQAEFARILSSVVENWKLKVCCGKMLSSCVVWPVMLFIHHHMLPEASRSVFSVSFAFPLSCEASLQSLCWRLQFAYCLKILL